MLELNDTGDKPLLLTTVLKLRAAYASLRAAEKRAADYIAEHPDDVIHLSVTELAERSGTSESTVVRMCQQAGFRGFQELKIAIAQDLVAPIKNIHEDVAEEDDTAAVLRKVFAANIQTLENTRAIVDPGELERATEALIEAGEIAVLAAGNSGPVALDCQYKLMRIGLRCQAFLDPHIQLVHIARLGPGDVALAISYSGSSREVVEALTACREMGLLTICITGYAKSPLAKAADIKLHTSAVETMHRTEAMVSHVAQLTITDALEVNVALRVKERALENIRRVERLLPGKKF